MIPLLGIYPEKTIAQKDHAPQCLLEHYLQWLRHRKGFLGGSDSKESACNTRDWALIPGLGRSLGEVMATPSNILAWYIPLTEEYG